MKKVIAFLDALEPSETTGWLQETKQGKVDSGVPRVTPPIIGSFLTGKVPGEHGLVRATPLYKPHINKPDGTTLIEKLAERCHVLSYQLPCTKGIKHHNATVVESGSVGTMQPDDPMLVLPQPQVEPEEHDAEYALHSWVDSASNVFTTTRQLIRKSFADTYIISFRHIDSATHYWYHQDVRKRLIDYVAYEMKQFTLMGDDIDVMWFSDHGGHEMTDHFPLNRWLIEKGYLDVTILLDRYNEELKKLDDMGQKVHWQQIDMDSMAVQIEPTSTFCTTDAFDSCIEVLPAATEKDIKDLIKDLESCGHYDAVHRKKELWPDHDHPQVPEIIPDRKLGHIVSSNVHPDAMDSDVDSVVTRRSGGHSRHGCYGGTINLSAGTVTPMQLHDLALEFCADVDTSEEQREILSPEDEAIVKERLNKMGYL